MRQSSLLLRKSTISSLVLLAISASQAQAQLPGQTQPTGQFKYVLKATAQYEGIENPNRLYDNDDTDELRQGRIAAQLNRATSRISTNLDYQYDYIDYRKNSLQDRTFATGSGTISYMPIRDVLSWDLSHIRQMQAIDAALPTTVNNVQVIKTTETGPRLSFNLGARNVVRASYMYSRSASTFNSIFKQERGTVDVLFQRQLTSNLSSGLRYNEFNTFSESSPLAKYDRTIASWDNSYQSEKYQGNIDVGYIESSADLSSDYYNLGFTYIPITGTTLSLNYTNTVEDMFSNLLNARGGVSLPINASPNFNPNNGGGTGSFPSFSSNLAQQYEVDRGSVTLAHQVPDSLTYSLQYSTEDRVFGNLNDNTDPNATPDPNTGNGSIFGNDQSVDSFSLIVGMPVGRNINLTALARDSDLYFRTNDRMQHRQEYSLSANWSINRSFSLQLGVSQVKQKGDTLLDTYEGASAMIAFTYTLAN